MSKPKLLPCPFCGTNGETRRVQFYDTVWFVVGCSARKGAGFSSHCVGKHSDIRFDTEQEAINAWNTRRTT